MCLHFAGMQVGSILLPLLQTVDELVYTQIVIIGGDKFLELWDTRENCRWSIRAHDGLIRTNWYPIDPESVYKQLIPKRIGSLKKNMFF
ncbi:hypothetical protein ACOSP7_012005 [Xanthoceras sorbifolium]